MIPQVGNNSIIGKTGREIKNNAVRKTSDTVISAKSAEFLEKQMLKMAVCVVVSSAVKI